ncbi:treslin-like [Argonauta hians]
MDLNQPQKYQVVFLIDKSLKTIIDEGNNPKDPGHKSSEDPSSLVFESQNIPKSYTWKSISLSSFRILTYLFSQIKPHISSKCASSNSAVSLNSNLNNLLSDTLTGNNSQLTDTNDSSVENLKEQSQKIAYMKKRQASLQWSYKFFDSGKLTGKTEHHRFKDFKLRHFEEFEKDLLKEFDVDDGGCSLTQPDSKYNNSHTNSGNSTEKRKSKTPSAAECLKRTLSYTIYDFHWESPDITSPVRNIGKSRLRSSGRLNTISANDSSTHNLVFLFQRCPTSKAEFKEFASKLVVDSEVFLDSFMPPALFREFRVNRKLSLYWIDQDWLKHEKKVSCEMVESINIVSDALTQLGGRLIPLDALVNTGKIYWSSVHTVLKQTTAQNSGQSNPNEQSPDMNSIDSKEGSLEANHVNSPNNIATNSYNQTSRCVFPISSLLDYFITKPPRCNVQVDAGQTYNSSKIFSIPSRLIYHKEGKIEDLCSLVLIPSTNYFKQTLIKNDSCGDVLKFNSDDRKDLLISLLDKHQLNSDNPASPVEFSIKNPEELSTGSSPSTSKTKSLPQSSQHLLSFQMEMYGYLVSTDLSNCSDCVFFCAPLSEQFTSYPNSLSRGNHTSRTKYKNQESNKERSSQQITQYQNLLLNLTKTNLLLVVQIKFDEESAPYIGVLQPITVSLATLTILPMGLNCKLKQLHPVERHPSGLHIYFTCDTDKLDSVLDRYSNKILGSKHHSVSALDKGQSGKASQDLSSTVFDLSILNKWTIPKSENPEILKMSKFFCKKQPPAKEVELLKKLKQLYRKADSPSRLIDKAIMEEKPSNVSANLPEENLSQKADNLKPRLLKKIRSFTVGPTRAEMILSKSMAVVEELSKTESEEPVSCTRQNEDSKRILHEVNTIVKCITNHKDLVEFILQSYATSLQERLDPWKQIYLIVNVVLHYVKVNNTNSTELETKTILMEHLYISCCDLRHKYRNPEFLKETKIQEYKLQIILRLEIQCLKLVCDKTESGNIKDSTDNADIKSNGKIDVNIKSDDSKTDDANMKDNSDSMETSVEDVVTMLRTMSFISDLTLMPVFLKDVLLESYSHLIPQVIANIYDELMQPIPSVLADVISPQSDIPSTFCPSSVSSYNFNESVKETAPNEILPTQLKKPKLKQVLPGLGERKNRQIIIGKKSTAQMIKRRLSASKCASDKKRSGGVVAKDTVKARRSLFTSDSRKLERHRSFAVTEKEKINVYRKHQKRKHIPKDSVRSKKKKTIVAETPAHKQTSQMMRRWHLLQNRMTEPLELVDSQPSCQSPPFESQSTPLIIEESPLKEIQSAKPSRTDCNQKTKVLIRKGFYGLNRTRSKSRNIAKYMVLADRIAGRRDRYAKLTNVTSLSQSDASAHSPLDQPNTFALSQLLGFQSPSPKSDNASITSSYTPNPKSEAFPFSRSPIIRKRTSEHSLVKQALFTTPEKISMPSTSSSLPHCNNNKHDSINSNKVELEKTEDSIFKTPTKQAPHSIETCDEAITCQKMDQNGNESMSVNNVGSHGGRNEFCMSRLSHQPQQSLQTLKKNSMRKRRHSLETNSITQPTSTISGEEDISNRASGSTLVTLPTKLLQTPSPKPSVNSSTPDSLDKWKRKKYYYKNKKLSHIHSSTEISDADQLNESNGQLHFNTNNDSFLQIGSKQSKRKSEQDSNCSFLRKRRKCN